MSALSDSFTGRHVTVLSNTGAAEHTDTGTLVAMDDTWIQLAKDNGEVLIFPYTAVRVIKLLDVEPAYTVPKEAFRPAPAAAATAEPLR